ncbi:MAG: polyprenyl synthetase family protein [Cyclobacteriaceae bacterium]|nr:polyprenyl synthetase family protein [Cyclobacteriaceae bacterium]
MLRPADRLKSLLDNFIEQERYGDNPETLYTPLHYIMQLGGKRLRPMLVLMGYQLFGDHPEKILSQALSVELFHNFTLMHDDIMDNAPLRRGQQTVHEKWDNNRAILSGDVMLVRAYDYLIRGKAELSHELVSLFNDCAAAVCEGQQFDMDFEKKEEVSEQEYLGMIRLKTAVLIGYSLELGAALGGDHDNRQYLRDFGINIGLGFQLKDDLLDLYADQDKFGKQIGGDIISRKKTFLYITALAQGSETERSSLKELYSTRCKLSDEARVKDTRNLFDQLGVREKTEERIAQYFEKAFESLRKIDAPLNRKSLLKKFTENLIGRQQ